MPDITKSDTWYTELTDRNLQLSGVEPGHLPIRLLKQIFSILRFNFEKMFNIFFIKIITPGLTKKI